jgi:dihydroneopterin aldolase/2-amino-4-hydroxy-6-hydroxymethyldihydropteridine diphosphokinase/dihydropteroate synthase/2-amino-4-hydroxy-6-hydroxymethyldihydropteridine diphosphokinase/dihydropteroate synthase
MLQISPSWDWIHIRELEIRNRVGVDSWELEKPQPLCINVSLGVPCLDSAGACDQITNSVNYGAVTRLIAKYSEASSFRTMEAMALGIIRNVLQEFQGIGEITVQVEKPRALLHAECAGVNICRRSDLSMSKNDYLYIRNLCISTIVGIHPWERVEKQLVLINVSCYSASSFPEEDRVSPDFNYRSISSWISDYVEQSTFKTLEALVHHTARTCLERFPSIESVRLKIEKPSALLFAKSPGLEIVRSQKWLRRLRAKENFVEELLKPKCDMRATVYLALGSNMGDRAGLMHRALRELQIRGIGKLIDTSFLYESSPMYVLDQPPFLNSVIKV